MFYHFSSLISGRTHCKHVAVHDWLPKHFNFGGPSAIHPKLEDLAIHQSSDLPIRRHVSLPIARSLELSNLDPTFSGALRAPRTHKVKVRSNLLPQATRGVF